MVDGAVAVQLNVTDVPGLTSAGRATVDGPHVDPAGTAASAYVLADQVVVPELVNVAVTVADWPHALGGGLTDMGIAPSVPPPPVPPPVGRDAAAGPPLTTTAATKPAVIHTSA